MAEKFPIETKPLHVPDLQELADVLNKQLTYNFHHVEANVVDCPDLTQRPFTLASPGLNGNTAIVEVGGPPYLLPLVQRDKVYDLKDLANLVQRESVLIIGAGAGPHPFIGKNCEGIINIKINGRNNVSQQTRIAKVNSQDGSFTQEILPNNETRLALLANLFFTNGEPGKVLKVHAKKRIGADDFVASIRKSLADHYGRDRVVGLGGTFLLKEGQARQHVMPDFSATPLNTDNDLNKWLQFYNMSAPLIAVGTLVTDEYGMDLRVQHFHSFSHHGEAGHYHIDVTPDTVEYLGYFVPGAVIHRIDKPTTTHQIGRD